MQQRQRGFCDYFGFLFISFCVPQYNREIATYREAVKQAAPVTQIPETAFSPYYQWNYVNFTWPSQEVYQSALDSKNYIPENVAIGGIKSYRDRIYYALPRIRDGTPVTLASTPRKDSRKTNILLSPYPSWEMNAQSSCDTLQNVQSMEIDRKGIMWVIDGIRFNSNSSCPAKLVLLDLNKQGNVIFTYTFANEIVSQHGGYMNDIVLDETDGGYAYITDASSVDPGLIVYSKRENKSWKLRDATMFPEKNATNITISDNTMQFMSPIDGIALSPLTDNRSDDRVVYYSALSGYNLYAISTKAIKSEEFCKSGTWRVYVKFVGKKQSQSDGLIVDNQGNLYYTLLQTNSVGKWNIYEEWSNDTATVFYTNQNELIWPRSFGFDSSGYLNLLASDAYASPSYNLTTSQIRIRVFRIYTGNKNYMFTGK